MKKVLSLVVLIAFVTFISCNDDDNPIKKGEVSFLLAPTNLLNSLGNPQSLIQQESLHAIRITVESDQGEPVLSGMVVELALSGDNYVTEPIKLKQGSYTLTQFEIVNEGGEVTFETPGEGAENADLVTDPLVIEFTVSKERVEIQPDVLSTTESIGFKVAVYSFNSTSQDFELSESHVEITSDSETLADQALTATTNQVDIKKTDSYSLIVTKPGHLAYTRSFSLSEIQVYAIDALQVRLYEESTATGLEVYYPFSGNADDHSGNELHGVNEGAVLSPDMHGNLNSSYAFDGVNDRIELGNILDNLGYPFTVSAWIKVSPEAGTFNVVLTSQDNSAIYNGFDFVFRGTHAEISTGDGRGSNSSAFRRGKYQDFADVTGVWKHFCVVVNGSNDMILYINGEDVGGAYTGESTFDMASNFPTDVARIGLWTSSAGDKYYFKGSIDELRVWSKSLTQIQVKSSM